MLRYKLAEDGQIPVVMLKEFAYCPRIPYYWFNLRLEYATYSMETGREITVDLLRRLLERKGFRIRRAYWQVPVASRTLGLRGTVDAVIEDGEGTVYVFDGKLRIPRKHNHLLVQVGAYAIAIEETMKVSVDKIGLLGVEDGRIIVKRLSPELRRLISRIAFELRRTLVSPEPPMGTRDLWKCSRCQYRVVCTWREEIGAQGKTGKTFI